MRLTQHLIACIAAIAPLGAAQAAPAAAKFQTLYSFSGSTDGVEPSGKLVMDTAGILYGVTLSGGTAQRGNIFSFDPSSSVLTSLYSFSGGADGSNPQSGLALDTHGNLYGVTPFGGSTYTAPCSSGCGTIFKFNLAKAKLTTLYSFTGKADGAVPLAALLLQDGTLYGSAIEAGTNPDCGAYGCGTIFRLVLATKVFTTLHNFAADDGQTPEGKLVMAPSGLLYGSNGSGGDHGSGTDFGIDPGSGAYGVLHAFNYHVDGSGSFSDLIIKGGQVYGTMHAGGPSSADDGTIYRLDPSSGAVTTMYSFQGRDDGLFPTYGVVLGPKGMLYGATDQGGASGAGTLFKIDPKTFAYKQIHAFSGADGVSPSGPLLAEPGGVLFGLTSGGGRGHGTIFQIVP